MTPKIISVSDFTGRITLPSNLRTEILNPYIIDSEDFDLCELMGNTFFYDFMASFNSDGTQKTSASQAYKNLYLGVTYTHKDVNYVSPGVKPVLVYFAGARLVKGLDMHITPNGIMQKRNEFSDHSELKEKVFQSTQYENQAIAYWNKVVIYLDANKDSFQYWKTNCCEHKSGYRPRMQAVGKEGFNDHDNYLLNYGVRRR
jgi:hypothetical protein